MFPCWSASLHVSFLGSWVGWLGGEGAGLPMGSLHVSFVGSWVGVGRGKGAGLALGSLHVSFRGSWVEWVDRQRGWVHKYAQSAAHPGAKAGLGMSFAASCFPCNFLGPRQQGWTSSLVLSCFCCVPVSAKGLGYNWAPICMRSHGVLSSCLAESSFPWQHRSRMKACLKKARSKLQNIA